MAQRVGEGVHGRGEREQVPEREEGGLSFVPDRDDRVEGTTLYLPPECVRGRAPDRPADVWALGCMFFQMVTGELLIEGLCGGEGFSLRLTVGEKGGAFAVEGGLACEELLVA